MSFPVDSRAKLGDFYRAFDKISAIFKSILPKCFSKLWPWQNDDSVVFIPVHSVLVYVNLENVLNGTFSLKNTQPFHAHTMYQLMYIFTVPFCGTWWFFACSIKMNQLHKSRREWSQPLKNNDTNFDLFFFKVWFPCYLHEMVIYCKTPKALFLLFHVSNTNNLKSFVLCTEHMMWKLIFRHYIITSYTASFW